MSGKDVSGIPKGRRVCPGHQGQGNYGTTPGRLRDIMEEGGGVGVGWARHRDKVSFSAPDLLEEEGY